MCPEKHAALATTDQNINPYVLIARRFTAAPEPPYGTGCHRRNDVVRFDRVYRCWSGSYERADHHVGCPHGVRCVRRACGPVESVLAERSEERRVGKGGGARRSRER